MFKILVLEMYHIVYLHDFRNNMLNRFSNAVRVAYYEPPGDQKCAYNRDISY